MDLSMICSLMLCMCALNRVTIGQMDREIYIGELDKKEFGSFDSLTAPSAIACCVTCSWNERCKTVNYHKTTGECQLLPSPAAVPEPLTDSPGWTWYHPEEGSCGWTWRKHGSSCYAAVTTTLTWKQSQEQCFKMDATIVHIDDQAEWEFISNLKNASIDVHPFRFTPTTDETKGCMPEMLHHVFPSAVNQSVCNVNMFEEKCSFYVRGALALTTCHDIIFPHYLDGIVCEKHVIY